MHTSSSKVLPIKVGNAGNAIKLLPAKFLLLLLSYLKAKLYLIIYLFILSVLEIELFPLKQSQTALQGLQSQH